MGEIGRREAIATIGAMTLSTAGMGSTNMIDPVAETRHGKVRGIAAGGCLSFKGIRYARAARFMPPRAPESWAGVNDAAAYGAIAPQSNANPPPGPPAVILAQLPRPASAPPPLKPVEDEDCLFLNVWTSGLRDGRKRPVMVWLHGGFFSSGSGASGDGTELARRGDVVVVSLNHRLNAFGFTHLADLAGDDFAHAGNAGMLDIIAALEWVRDNIEAFGGDPARVLLFGESGGGMKISFVMASPRAKGLIARAAIQSGPGLKFMARDRATQATEMLLAEIGLPKTRAADLRTVPADRLLAAYHAVAATLPPKQFIDLPCFAPVLDPELLPHHPFQPATAPLTRTIPLLVGWNRDEMSFFMGNDPQGFTLDEAAARQRLTASFGQRGDAAYDLYRRDDPAATPGRCYIRALSAYSIMVPTLALADRQIAAGGTVHAYRFDRASPALGGKLGAFHTSEAPYVFDATERSAAITGATPEAKALAHVMSGAWVGFAAHGDPTGPGLMAWPAYDAKRRRTMLFDEGGRIAADPDHAAYDLMAPLLDA